MNFNKLYLMINNRKKVLEEIFDEQDKNLVFFEKFVNNNSFNVSGLLNIDYTDLISVYLYGISKELCVDEIREIVLNCKFIKEHDFDSMTDLFNLLWHLKNNDTVKEIPEKELASYVKRKISKNIDFSLVKRLYDIYDSGLVSIIAIVSVIDKMKLDYDYNSMKTDFLYEFFELSNNEKHKKKEVVSKVKDKYNVKRIFDSLSSVINREYSNLKSENNKKKKSAKKSIMNYAMLVSNLNKYKKEQLLNKNNINDMINMIEDEDILREFLIQINNLQKEYFDELNREYLKLSSDSSVSIHVVLNKYNIDFNKLSVSLKNKLLKEEKENLENFLKLIKEIGITDFDMICYLLEKSDSLIVGDFVNLIKDGIISYDFLINNKELFEVENHKNMKEKIKLFKDEGINYRLFINDLDVYLIDNNKLLGNINILKQYKLLVGVNRLSSFEMLKDNNLEVKIDMLLELGYEKILEENLDILNFDVLKIKKLYILKSLGMLPDDYDRLVNIFNNKTILDSIDDVDSYLFNISSYKIDDNVTFSGEVDYSKFYSNERVIEIGGVILSLNRIKRNFSKLDNVLMADNEKIIYAILKDSIFDEEEYNLILNNLSDIKSKIY